GMAESINNREASATIRGYIYQFDATIRKILASDARDLCTVEDVEDFDIHASDLSSYFQCKYYAAQKLTASVLRDAILPMLKNYVGLNLSERSNKRYFLYGHFKESSYTNGEITSESLKTILVRREKLQSESDEKSYRTINVQDEIGATDDDLEGFVLQFSLELCSEYEEHKKTVVDELSSILSVSQLEAESYIYPSALTLISTLACKKTVENRTISKETFLQKVQPNRALYSLWSLRERSQRAYCREMRTRYFSRVNIDPEARFFILEFPEGTPETDIRQTLLVIRKKWSSHMARRKPDKDRYAPYIFLSNTPPENLANIKKTLHQEGYVFLDGHSFKESDFSVTSISQQQTYQNKISIRFINNEDNLRSCLAVLEQP
ncbi:hypothetical protein KA005_37170, partial [bacterium]|nr:hypothetical protein [bacterium]